MRKLIIVLAAIFAPIFSYAAYTGGVLGGALIVPTWYAPDATSYVTISSHTRVSDGGSNYVDIDPIVGFSGPGAGLTDLDWAELGNFPASCAPQCVVAIGNTLTCGDCSGGGGGLTQNYDLAYATGSLSAAHLPGVRLSTTPITGADVNSDILLSTNPYVAKTNQYNQFTSSQSISVSGVAKVLEVLNSTGTLNIGTERAAIIGSIQGTGEGVYGVYGRGDDSVTYGYGVFGESEGGSGAVGVLGRAYGAYFNAGIYGIASGGTENWAGYFSGRVYSTHYYGSGYFLTNLQASHLSGAVPNSLIDLSTAASKSSDNNFSATQTFQYGFATSTASFSSTATFNAPVNVNSSITISSNTWVSTRNYNGGVNSWRLDLFVHQMFCTAQVQGAYSVAINAANGTSCNTACAALSTYTSCQSGSLYNDFNSAYSTRVGPGGCAATDYIKYCCCKAP